MSNYVTLHGFASSDVELDTKESGLVIGKLRMGSTHRVQDPVTNMWVDGSTNWFRVNLFRSLAHNVAASVHKGDHIIVSGKLRIKTWLRLDGSQGMAVEIDAETVGNDLKFGTCTYHRNATLRTGAQGQYPQGQSGHATPPSNPIPDVDGVRDESALLNDREPYSEGETLDGDTDPTGATAEELTEVDEEEDDDQSGAENTKVDAGDGLVAYASTGELVDSAAPPY